MKQVDYALLSSQPILNNEGLFGPMNGALCDGVSTVFVEFGELELPYDGQST